MIQLRTPHPPSRSRATGAAGAAAALAVALLLAAAGCSSSTPSATTDTSAASPSTTATTASPGGTGSTLATIPAGTATVDVGTTDLGDVLVDLSGHTLYVFTADGPGSPSCVDASCTKVWPPLTGSGIAVGTGVPAKPGEFKLVPRPDGTQQLTVNGQPLYTFSGDAGPGDTAGQGIGGTRFVVGTDGTAIKG
jgi:predicted lipoprotein with Yx(FWY)xxD motif